MPLIISRFQVENNHQKWLLDYNCFVEGICVCLKTPGSAQNTTINFLCRSWTVLNNQQIHSSVYFVVWPMSNFSFSFFYTWIVITIFKSLTEIAFCPHLNLLKKKKMHIHKITTDVSLIHNCLHIIIGSYLITVYPLFNTMTCGQGGRVTITYYNSSDKLNDHIIALTFESWKKRNSHTTIS